MYKIITITLLSVAFTLAVPTLSQLNQENVIRDNSLNPDQAPEWLSQNIQEPVKTPDGLDITTWDTLAPYPITLHRGMSCVDDSGYFYTIGGQSPIINVVNRYSLRTNTWTALPNLPESCSNQTACFWKDDGGGTDSSCVFVVGSYKRSASKTCFRWTKRTNSWDTIAQYPAPIAQTGNMAAVIGDTLYLMARRTSAITGFYKYHVRSGAWVEGITPLDSLNYYGAICAYGGRIWQLGGYSNRQTFQSYLPGTGWTLLPSPPGNVGGNSGYLAGHSGKIFAWGGGYSWTPWNGMAVFDTLTNAWIQETNLPQANGFGFYCAIMDTLGVFGLHNAAGYCPTVGNKHWRGVWSPGLLVDVGVQRIFLSNNLINGEIKNFGTVTANNIPVTCWVDSANTRIYTDNLTIPNLNAGDTTTVTFDFSTSGRSYRYEVTIFTSLIGDTNPHNDTAHLTIGPWKHIAMPAHIPDRLTHGAVYDPNTDNIFMFGGTPDGSAGSEVYLCQEYDPVNDTWIERALMPTAKGWIQGAIVRGKIYAIGGYDNSSNAISENACYDIATNTWSLKASRPRIGACDQEVVWRDSLIYVMGGTNLYIGYDFVDIYDPFTNSWYVGTPLPHPADMGDAAIIGDTIFMISPFNRGITHNWDSLYKGAINPANPAQITWIQGPALLSSSSRFPGIGAAAALGDRVYWLDGDSLENTRICYYQQGSNTIHEFFPYPIIISRTQMLSRTAVDYPELYFLAGDSASNWEPPNRTYLKYTFYPTSITSNKKPTNLEHNLSIVPNPARSYFTVRLSPAANRIKILDVTGKVVKVTSAQSHKQDIRISLKGINSGVYFVRLEPEGKIVKKLIVMK